jgi:hypothetical protein
MDDNEQDRAIVPEQFVAQSNGHRRAVDGSATTSNCHGSTVPILQLLPPELPRRPTDRPEALTKARRRRRPQIPRLPISRVGGCALCVNRSRGVALDGFIPETFYGRRGNELTHAPRSAEVGAAQRHGEGGGRRDCLADKRAPMVSDPGRGRVSAAGRRHLGSACQSHGTDAMDSTKLKLAARGVISGLDSV